MPDGPLLLMEGVTKGFGAELALDRVSLRLDSGEVLGLVGENGAGKSTLMKVLSGAYRPDAGIMSLAGEPFAPRSPREALRRGVVMIYQELALAPHLSVEANVMLGQEHRHWGFIRQRRHREIVREALRLLDHPDIRTDAIVGRLSVGAQQLVEIARALVSDARVLILDEPTSALTEHDAERLFRVIDRLRERGLAIVYISHFLEEIQRVAQRWTVLRDGRVVAGGPMDGTALGTIVGHMVGRELSEMFPRVPHVPGEPILELAGLSGRRLPAGVNLTLRRGEILGIAGLIGAGRTELLRAVFGLASVRQGTIKVAGQPIGAASVRDRITMGMGFLSENRKEEGLALARSIEDNLTYSALSRYTTFGWLHRKPRRESSRAWMKHLRIRAISPGQAVGGLSGGNQQKVALARLLHQDADILLLDEPTRGIDVATKAEIYRLIGEQAALGKAILLISSYLPELLGICDRVAVMRRGALVAVRSASEWNQHAIMEVAIGQGIDS